jgi:tRNA-Thr(GGU) m(6)t(6)A37 methyltransferase TsaA
MNLNPIGIFHSCYKEKFGIPSNTGQILSATGHIEMIPDFSHESFFRGLETFSHLWLIFGFHKHESHKKVSMVRPPRLGGNKKMGVFATRSSFRPSSLGLSAVKLESIEIGTGPVRVHVSNHDLLDQTPIFDIKPYIPYADKWEATGGWTDQNPLPKKLEVSFSPAFFEKFENLVSPEKRKGHLDFFMEVISNDPRPPFHQNEDQTEKIYGAYLHEFNIQWKVVNYSAILQNIELN